MNWEKMKKSDKTFIIIQIKWLDFLTKNDWIFQIMYKIYSIFFAGLEFFDNNFKSNYGLSHNKITDRPRERTSEEYSIWLENSGQSEIPQTNKVHES